MSLREIAARDARTIFKSSCGARWGVDLTAPDGTRYTNVYGRYNDIAQVIDPETGAVVSGRSVTLALSIPELDEANTPHPCGVPDEDRTPWIVDTLNLKGDPLTFAVSNADPDEALGVLVCTLEAYNRAI